MISIITFSRDGSRLLTDKGTLLLPRLSLPPPAAFAHLTMSSFHTSVSLMMMPGVGCAGTTQRGYRALCVQYSLLLPWAGTKGPSDPECDIWASFAYKASGPLNEGYAAMNQEQCSRASSRCSAHKNLWNLYAHANATESTADTTVCRVV